MLFGCISVVVLFVLYKKFSESPRWLASQGKFEEADNIVGEIEKEFREQGIKLKKVGTPTMGCDSKKSSHQNVAFKELFGSKLRKRTICACCLLFAMNFLVYTFTNWTSTILVFRGLSTELSLGATASILLGAPFGTLMLVMFSDKQSRKSGLTMCLLVLSVLSLVWIVVLQTSMSAIILVGFVFCAWIYYYSLLACSVYVGELFPTQIRLRGVGFANAIGRIASAISPLFLSGEAPFSGMPMIYFVCMLVCLITAIVLFCFGTETRYRTLEDINDFD